MTKEEVMEIMRIINEAYTKNGRKIETAVQIEEVDEDGNIIGEVLIDTRETKDVN